MTAACVALPGNEATATALAHQLGLRVLPVQFHQFPDGETYVRAEESPEGLEIILVCTLFRPNERIVPLLLAAQTMRDLGASRVGLVAPYLGYLRQDVRFNAGEGVTSRYVAQWLSAHLDWLVTVDPHLHRYDSLGEIYAIPSAAVAAAPAVADWIAATVPRPHIIGPDSESEQWVTAVARRIDAPVSVLQKIRHGDRHVEITLPAEGVRAGCTPVLVDDIVSTARTMARAAQLLRDGPHPAVVCVGIHGVFADDVLPLLTDAGAAQLVTTNTIPRPCARIDIVPLLAPAVGALAG